MPLLRCLLACCPRWPRWRSPARRCADDLPTLVAKLATGKLRRSRGGDRRARRHRRRRARRRSCEALGDGELYVRKADKLVFIGKADGDRLALIDAADRRAGRRGGRGRPRRKVRGQQRAARASIRDALGTLTLLSARSGACGSRRPRPCSSTPDPAALAGARRGARRGDRRRRQGARSSRRAPPPCSTSDAAARPTSSRRSTCIARARRPRRAVAADRRSRPAPTAR